MSYIDYVHVFNTFSVSNNKNISKVKETQDKKLCNLFLRNLGKNSNTCQDLDKVNLDKVNLDKIVLSKGLSFAIPPKTIEYLEFFVSLKMLFRARKLVILIRNVLKVITSRYNVYQNNFIISK